MFLFVFRSLPKVTVSNTLNIRALQTKLERSLVVRLYLSVCTRVADPGIYVGSGFFKEVGFGGPDRGNTGSATFDVRFFPFLSITALLWTVFVLVM